MPYVVTNKAIVQFAQNETDSYYLENPRTPSDLAKIDYSEKQRQAVSVAQIAVASHAELSAEQRLKYTAAFAEKLISRWADVTREHDAAVRNWERATQGLTIEQATTKARELLESFRIRGARVSDSLGSLSLTARRSFSVEADLYVRFESNYDKKTVNPDNDQQFAGQYACIVQLNWATTTRTVSDAVAAIKLYQELTEAAAEVEGVMALERIVWTFGVETVAAETEPVA